MNKKDKKRIEEIFINKIDQNIRYAGHLAFDKMCAECEHEESGIQEEIEREFSETCRLRRLMNEILEE